MSKSLFLGIFAALFTPHVSLADKAPSKVSVNKKTSNELKSEVRQVTKFNAISTHGSMRVEVKKGKKLSLTIRAEEKVLSKIESVVKNDQLTLKMNNVSTNKPVLVFINTPSPIVKVTLAGSGRINFPDTTWKQPSFTGSISGSGRIAIKLETEKVVTSISGSGRVEMVGTAKLHEVQISGSGKIIAGDLKADACSMNISGSGKVLAGCKDKLNARIMGAGRIDYIGSPKVSSQVYGSGRINQTSKS